jgi:hypothetical protein
MSFGIYPENDFGAKLLQGMRFFGFSRGSIPVALTSGSLRKFKVLSKTRREQKIATQHMRDM